ncbi:MAG: hypothetical protein WAM14_26465 [Candidatus Nitrosopolaris sp.]
MYDDLVKRYDVMKKELRKEQEQKAGLEQTLLDFIEAYETFRERIIKISFSIVSICSTCKINPWK